MCPSIFVINAIISHEKIFRTVFTMIKAQKAHKGVTFPLKMHFKDVCDFLYKPTNNVGNVVNLVRSDNMENEK